jgi:hypothetical protein
MASLNCATFFAKAGWHCQMVPAGGAMAAYISTPIVLPGGKPLDFYLIPRSGIIEFTDDGMTMFALRCMGYPLGDKRNWRGLENIGTKFGFTLGSSGAFEAMFPENELDDWSGRIIRLFSALAAWEEDRYSEGDTDFSLTDEIAMLLHAKAPGLKLTRNVTVKLGKTEATFDFLWGDTYVDAIRPVQQAVNARLRKALLVNRSEESLHLLFIIDDREQQEKADDEIAVLGEIAQTIRLTDFERHYSQLTH